MTAPLDLMAFLREVPVLRGLADEDLAALAPALRPQTFQTDELIVRAGEAAPREFYLIRAGVVRVLLPGQGLEAVKRLGPGECFGQAVLLRRRRAHVATLQAAEPVQLLALSAENFTLLIDNYPRVRARLLGSEEVRRGFQRPKPPRRWRLGRNRAAGPRPRFEWLHRGEKLYLVLRRHRIVLAEKIWLPIALWVVGWVVALGIGFAVQQWSLVLILMLVIALAAGVFIYTGWLNWSNDFFVLTNRRVIHLERDLFYSETREETFLSGIRSLDFKKPDFWARQLNMGHITVKTLAAPVSMTYVPEVDRLHRILKKLWDRSQTWRYQVDLQSIRERLQPIVRPAPPPLIIGNVPDSEPPVIELTLPPTPAPRPSYPRLALRWILSTIRVTGDWLSRQMNTSFARLRYEEGDVVTYRRHWFLLGVRLFLPSAVVLGGFALLAVALGGILPATLSPTLAFVPGLVLLAVSGGWWLYIFEDWRNDLYQVNLDTIIALRRKPLGEEERSESPLDKVIKLKFERPNFMAVLLNYGTVVATVSTGDGEFRFEDVADPQAVQQDVSRRLKELQDRRQRDDKEKRRAELNDWFTVYHGEVNPTPPVAPPPQ